MFLGSVGARVRFFLHPDISRPRPSEPDARVELRTFPMINATESGTVM